MKNFSLKDENGKIYYGWWIVLAAALICGLVYSGIVSVTGVFMLPVTTELELPIGSYSFYLTVMSLTNIVTLLIISKFLNTRYHFIYRLFYGKVARMVLYLRDPAGFLLRSIHDDSMSDTGFELVR